MSGQTPVGSIIFQFIRMMKKLFWVSTTQPFICSFRKKCWINLNNDLSSDTNSNKDDWAGEFSNFVKSHVRELINRKLEYNLSDINSVTYDNGGLVFDYNHKHLFSFERIIDEDKPALKSFKKQDAEAFISHFNALKNRKDYSGSSVN